MQSNSETRARCEQIFDSFYEFLFSLHLLIVHERRRHSLTKECIWFIEIESFLMAPFFYSSPPPLHHIHKSSQFCNWKVPQSSLHLNWWSILFMASRFPSLSVEMHVNYIPVPTFRSASNAATKKCKKKFLLIILRRGGTTWINLIKFFIYYVLSGRWSVFFSFLLSNALFNRCTFVKR